MSIIFDYIIHTISLDFKRLPIITLSGEKNEFFQAAPLTGAALLINQVLFSTGFY
jgi:hypothetical protein